MVRVTRGSGREGGMETPPGVALICSGDRARRGSGRGGETETPPGVALIYSGDRARQGQRERRRDGNPSWRSAHLQWR